jgi:von Hippel-Lindau disease tumor supressor
MQRAPAPPPTMVRRAGRAHSRRLFLKFAEQPQVDVRLLFGRIRDEVVRVTRRQEPGIYVSLGGEEVYLNSVAVGPALLPAPAALTEAERSWGRIESSEDIAIFEAFRRQYGKDNAVLDALAASKITALKRHQDQKLSTPQAEGDRKRVEAEAKRKAEESERQRLAVLKADEERGAVGSPTLACSQEHSVRSLEGGPPTAITFVNNSVNTVRVYWIDYQGTRKFYNEVSPGKSYVQQTYVTHPWVVTSSREECLGVYMPEPWPSRVVIAR